MCRNIWVLKSNFTTPARIQLTMNEITPLLPGLSPVHGKEIVARFDGGRLSSDGGVLVLREIEARLGIADLLAAGLPDARDGDRLSHKPGRHDPRPGLCDCLRL
jgi:hypothetical protein